MEPRTLDGGARSFFVSYLYVVQSARFGYRQTEMKHNKFKTNKETTAASQDQSQKPQQEYVFSNLPVSGIQGQTEIKHTKFQNKQVDNSSLDQTKSKTTRLQKRVSCGMVLMASTMLHEKCYNTVFQIGAPLIELGSCDRVPRNNGVEADKRFFSYAGGNKRHFVL